MPAYPSSNNGSKFQHGGALLVMLVILVMGITTVFVTSLSGSAISNKRNQTTADALARAKEALIGYAISYGDTHPLEPIPGYLPCPDITGGTSEGSSDTCGTAGANSMGRLPWKTLELSGVFDGQQDCLWFAVSGNYKNNPKVTNGKMNWDTPAQLHVFDSNGNELQAGEVVAVIFSPGVPLSGNSDRSGTTAPICGGNYSASAYLDNDTTHNINNADISAASFIMPHDHRDASGNVTQSINDQFVYITRQDIWAVIESRIAREAKKCLDDYALLYGGKYPWAVPISTPTAFSPLMMGEYDTRFGRLSTRPSVQTESTPSMITTMQTKFNELWIALAEFAASKTLANLTTMQTKASAAKDAADTVKDYYNDSSDPPIEISAKALKNSAKDAKDKLTASSSTAAIADIQQAIVNAANDFTDAMTLEFSQASGMENTWPASCTLFASERWNHWKDLIFYQLAEGFKPGTSSPACGSSCLSITGSGLTAIGSGSYRAVVIGAGKKISANRDVSTSSDYLEPDNLLPYNDITQPYKTYRSNDANYQSINDHVLCLDTGVNCK